MGCGGSKPPVSNPQGNGGGASAEAPIEAAVPGRAEVIKSNQIEKELEIARKQEKKKFKLLLLGAGESGKSTILKQMRILHGAPWDDDELRMYGVVVRSNAIVAVKKLCLLINKRNLEDKLAEEPENPGLGMTPKAAYDDICSYVTKREVPPPQDFPEGSENDWVGESPRAGIGPNVEARLFLHKWKEMKCIWESATAKEIWQHRATVNLIDGHKLYLDSLERIASPTYKPSRDDILNARIKTTQVIVEKYEIENVMFELYDVGGQRSERRKWLDCFDDMDAVIFVAAISEYDQGLAESKKTNRMSEAIEVFRAVCRNRSFKDTPMVLFLNKKDVYAEKIQYSDIAKQEPFKDYEGPEKDFKAGAEYFISHFQDCMNKGGRKDQYIHVTCATDTEQMKVVMESTRKNTFKANLENAGMLGALP
mmetsp:Transcript_110528/g.165451  ORF Transcript_110528/g.165451 Transcript_110528/m.165451 type:complete len:423 (-) Transcript_110528:6-1274(-)